MDDQTSIEELKQKIKSFCEQRDWDQFHGAKDLAIGIGTEAAELLQIFRFKSEQQIDAIFQDPVQRAHILEELADTLYFTLRFAQKYNIDLSTALNDKLIKNDKKYPVHIAKGSNVKYNER